MVNRKNIMRVNLCESLRELMLKRAFEKITIKHICDEAGVIRATFYNYFEDKYDCLNTIISLDVVEPIDFEKDSLDDMFRKVIDHLEMNKEFYKTAYNIEGEFSFKNMLIDNISFVLNEYLKTHRSDYLKDEFSNPFISMYYATMLEVYLHEWLFSNNTKDYNRLKRLMSSNFFDFTK